MKLVTVLLSVSLVLGYEEPYQGFNQCGVNGWSCLYVKGKHEITYTCPKEHPNARVWVWTARLPVGASTFVVQNCNHLEVHMDCTKGLRTKRILREFRVINVTNLEILPPLLPMAFLHDNDQIPQAPPVLSLYNIKKIKLYPGMFDKPGGDCRYKFLELDSLTLENVHVDRIMKDLFHNQNMNSFVLKRVLIDAIDSSAIIIAADSTITETTFPFIPPNAISLRGERISFINNTFKKIQTKGLLIKSKEFTFSNNYVEEISTEGLDVLGAKIEITKNVFTHLETGAFQKITPGYSPLTYEIASKFVYNFSNNLLININPGSIHLNWEVYKKVCSDIIFKKNIFHCSCINLGWISISNGLGPKISKVKEFYDIYFNKDDNMCNDDNHCPLNVVIAKIQDVCNNKTNISMICSSTDNVTKIVTTSSPDDETIAMSYSIQDTTKVLKFQTDNVEITEKVIPLLSYTENQTSHFEARDSPVGFIVLIIIFLLAAVCLSTFVWWYKKRKQRQMVSTMYKNEKDLDADSLIVINEHHNELYDKE